MPAKIFILDTNVLLHDPESIFNFQDNVVVLPLIAIEELDRFKKQGDITGRNARAVSRSLDKLRELGSLTEGVDLNNGGSLWVAIGKKETIERLPKELESNSNDNKILAVALEWKNYNNQTTTLITKDANLRIKADILGIKAQDYLTDRVDLNELYSGKVEVFGCAKEIDELFNEGKVLIEDDLLPNEAVTIIDSNNPHHTALGIVDSTAKYLLPINKLATTGISRVRPKNREQQFALDLLLNDNIPLVTIIGKAGTGKTLLSCAAALYKVADEKKYDRILIARPIVPMGKDLGFLPGEIKDKLDPWMQPLYDNFDFILGSNDNKDKPKHWRRGHEELIEMGLLQIEALTYIRGRSIPNQFIIVDECFPYDTLVETEEGKRKIGGLFQAWIKGYNLPKVKSFNEHTQSFEFKQITQAWHRGIKNLVEITAGNKKVECTPDHKFLTSEGWVSAKDLELGSLIVSSNAENLQVSSVLGEDLEQIVLGSYLGDGSIETIDPNIHRLSIVHGENQKAYCEWKAAMFERKLEKAGSGYNPESKLFKFSTLTFGYKAKFQRPKATIDKNLLFSLNAKGLAIWFMDDGAIHLDCCGRLHTEAWDYESQELFVEYFNSLGIEARISQYKGQYFYLRFPKEAFLKLCSIISPYIHPNLDYKIHSEYKAFVGQGIWSVEKKDWGYSSVSSVNPLAEPKHVFDLEVEDNHNFVVYKCRGTKDKPTSGLVAHNCQNLTPHEIKTIVTRVADGTKIIFTGDLDQIDNPYVDAASNGLTYLIDRFKAESVSGHITLVKGERSLLAEKATELL